MTLSSQKTWYMWCLNGSWVMFPCRSLCDMYNNLQDFVTSDKELEDFVMCNWETGDLMTCDNNLLDHVICEDLDDRWQRTWRSYDKWQRTWRSCDAVVSEREPANVAFCNPWCKAKKRCFSAYSTTALKTFLRHSISLWAEGWTSYVLVSLVTSVLLHRYLLLVKID